LQKEKPRLCRQLAVANHPHNPGYKKSIITDFSQNFLRTTPFDKEPILILNYLPPLFGIEPFK